jgi:hypothetical protein
MVGIAREVEATGRRGTAGFTCRAPVLAVARTLNVPAWASAGFSTPAGDAVADTRSGQDCAARGAHAALLDIRTTAAQTHAREAIPVTLGGAVVVTTAALFGGVDRRAIIAAVRLVVTTALRGVGRGIGRSRTRASRTRGLRAGTRASTRCGFARKAVRSPCGRCRRGRPERVRIVVVGAGVRRREEREERNCRAEQARARHQKRPVTFTPRA